MEEHQCPACGVKHVSYGEAKARRIKAATALITKELIAKEQAFAPLDGMASVLAQMLEEEGVLEGSVHIKDGPHWLCLGHE